MISKANNGRNIKRDLVKFFAGSYKLPKSPQNPSSTMFPKFKQVLSSLV
jgi:hypothetical protein